MRPLSSTLQTLLLVCLFVSVARAAKGTSFCKCTCFSNSTIIPLDSPPPSQKQQHAILKARDVETIAPKIRKKVMTCNDCNRQFCLDYNLPICKGASEKDVGSSCFRRDSAKDEAVVFIFIFATVGLLAWAGIRPWVGSWVEAAKGRGAYTPIGTQGGDEGRAESVNVDSG